MGKKHLSIILYTTMQEIRYDKRSMLVEPIIGEFLLCHGGIAFEEPLIVGHDEGFATDIKIDERMDGPRD